MSQSGRSTRRARRGGFSLFKRRRHPPKLHTVEPGAIRSAVDRGDCQLGTSSDNKPPSKPWFWLLGGMNSRRVVNRAGQRQRNRSQQRPEASSQRRARYPQQAPPPPRQISASERYTHRLTQAARSTSSSLPALPPARWPAKAADSTSMVSRPSRGRMEPRSLRRNRSRLAATHLQANEPTLIQASTALQQNTVLQERERSELRRGPRSRNRQEVATRPRSRSLAIALYAARMLILSVGVGVLAGTILSAWNPSTNPFWENANQTVKQASSVGGKVPQPTTPAAQLTQAQELTPMKTAVQGTTQPYPGFTPGVFLIDLDTNNFMDWSGNVTFPAASTIKVPVLIAFFQDVDAGKIRLDEKLIMRKDLIAPESGDMQFLPPGAQFSALETATKMITISDNTATNMLIDRLGGIQALNQRFKSWGLSATQITNLLPDLKGTNTTSPKELASLMVRVSQGELVTLRSRDRLLDIMRRTVNNSQLPQGLGEGATIAHKTGDISMVIGDVGLVDMPSGKRYATAVLIRRSPNDDRAYDLVQKISRVMYQHLNTAPKRSVPVPVQPEATPANSTTSPQSLPNGAPNTPNIDPAQTANPE